MIKKEFKPSKSSKYNLLSLVIFLALLILVLAPIIFENLKYRNILSVLVLIFPFLLTPFSTVRKYSINRQYFYIHLLLGRKKMKIADLINVEKKQNLIEGSFSWQNLFKNQNLLTNFGKQEDDELGEYNSFVTDPEKIVLLEFRDKRIAISPEHPDRFIGYIRNYLIYH